MRTLGIAAVALGIAAALAAPAQAQGFRNRGASGYMLLTNKGVQQELKLDDAQIKKVTRVAEEVRARMNEKVQDLPDDDRRQRGPELARAASDEIKAAVKGVLKPEQAARLEQVSRQAQGIQAFSDPGNQKMLRLSEDQKAKLTALDEESNARLREIFFRGGAGGDRQAATQKIATLRKELLRKAVDVLNADQKKTWKDMTGEPFEVQFETRRPN